MAGINDRYCFVGLIRSLLLLTEMGLVRGDLSVQPISVAVVEARPVKFDCKSDTSNSNAVGWTRNLGAGDTVIVVACSVLEQYKAQYTVTRTAAGQCDLLFDSSSALAGRYRCSDATTPPTAGVAELTIIASNVTGWQGLEPVYEGDTYKISCSIHYHGTMKPSFTWLPSDYDTLTHNITSGVAESVIAVQAPEFPGSVPEYFCELHFPPPTRYADVYNWTSSSVNSSSCAANATIHGAANGTLVDSGTVLTCTAEAHPPAAYYWYNDVDGSSSVGERFVVVGENAYRLTCTASNDVDRPQCNSTDYIEINSTAATLTSWSWPTWSSGASMFTSTTEFCLTTETNPNDNCKEIVIALSVTLAVACAIVVALLAYIIHLNKADAVTVSAYDNNYYNADSDRKEVLEEIAEDSLSVYYAVREEEVSAPACYTHLEKSDAGETSADCDVIYDDVVEK